MKTPLTLAALLLAAAGLHAQTISVVETTADQTELLTPQPALTFTPGSNTQLPITIDDTVRYQPLDGVGASFTDSAAYLVWTTLTPAQRTAAMSKSPTARPSHSAWRNTAPESMRRPAPSSCATAGGSA